MALHTLAAALSRADDYIQHLAASPPVLQLPVASRMAQHSGSELDAPSFAIEDLQVVVSGADQFVTPGVASPCYRAEAAAASRTVPHILTPNWRLPVQKRNAVRAMGAVRRALCRVDSCLYPGDSQTRRPATVGYRSAPDRSPSATEGYASSSSSLSSRTISRTASSNSEVSSSASSSSWDPYPGSWHSPPCRPTASPPASVQGAGLAAVLSPDWAVPVEKRRAVAAMRKVAIALAEVDEYLSTAPAGAALPAVSGQGSARRGATVSRAPLRSTARDQ